MLAICQQCRIDAIFSNRYIGTKYTRYIVYSRQGIIYEGIIYKEYKRIIYKELYNSLLSQVNPEDRLTLKDARVCIGKKEKKTTNHPVGTKPTHSVRNL